MHPYIDTGQADYGEPGYYDLRNFPSPQPGETWVEARISQIAEIKRRSRETVTISDNSPSGGGWGGLEGVRKASNAVAELKSGARLRDMFADLLPKKPYCANELKDGLAIRGKNTALTRTHLQINGPSTVQWLPSDLDYRGAAIAHRDAYLPPPNVVVTTPENGHAHTFYLLEVPVARHDAARQAPLNLLAAVDRGLRRRLNADPAFTGLIVKNPTHPAWRTEWLRDAPYSLGEINDWLFSRDTAPYVGTSELAGFSRDVTIFDKLRKEIAYREVRAAKRAGKTLDEFQAYLQRRASEMNWSFATPLPLSEIRAISKSVAKWTWRNFSDDAFSRRQSFLGKRGMAKRWAGHLSAQSTQPWTQQGISRATYYRRMKGAAK